jgi:hypothetical protein
VSPTEAQDLALLREAFNVHVAEEGGQFALLNEKLGAITAHLERHVAEHRAMKARFVGLDFTLIGAAVIAVGSWLRSHLLVATVR